MLNSLIENSALELAPFGVRVNGVAPGITDTEIRVSDVFNKKDNKDYLNKMGDFFLLNKTILSPHGITALVIVAVSMASPGPRINKNFDEKLGMISSLKNNFNPSARG